MTLALTGYRAFGTEGIKAVSPEHFQNVEITITAANSDVSWDFGETGGTFWTAVGTTTIPAAAKALLYDVANPAKCAYALDLAGTFTGTAVKGHAATTGQYTEAAGTVVALHTLTFYTSEAPTTATILFRFKLKPGALPISANS